MIFSVLRMADPVANLHQVASAETTILHFRNKHRSLPWRQPSDGIDILHILQFYFSLLELLDRCDRLLDHDIPDLPAFLDAGMKATEKMRRVEFPLVDRAVLIPVELVAWGKYAAIAAVCLLALSGLNREGDSTKLVLSDGIKSAVIVLGGLLAAGILGPLLLPWLPGRAFSAKGLWIGLAMSLVLALCSSWSSVPGTISWFLMIPALTSYVVMNFTGASTYTSLSGVRREMRVAVPAQLICTVAGIGLWLVGRFV